MAILTRGDGFGTLLRSPLGAALRRPRAFDPDNPWWQTVRMKRGARRAIEALDEVDLEAQAARVAKGEVVLGQPLSNDAFRARYGLSRLGMQLVLAGQDVAALADAAIAMPTIDVDALARRAPQGDGMLAESSLEALSAMTLESVLRPRIVEALRPLDASLDLATVPMALVNTVLERRRSLAKSQAAEIAAFWSLLTASLHDADALARVADRAASPGLRDIARRARQAG